MVIADIAVMPLVPTASEEELYKQVDAAIDYIKKSGLKYEIDAMSTTVEGEYDEVFDLIKKVHRIPFEVGSERVITMVRIDEKKGGLTIEDKLKNYPTERKGK
ncbi:MTH1187 family thiamine-binding protein [Clostridium arbusti]|uniref:MTH1187 family thiamine-binding protein n=1 Tax=Clostridium arbusti TaxID=1137848 RepID=UPI00028862E8|nr:MTH1187 family thiamine-binding protein [Clostridium arbusti]